jgi:hypothetical protein
MLRSFQAPPASRSGSSTGPGRAGAEVRVRVARGVEDLRVGELARSQVGRRGPDQDRPLCRDPDPAEVAPGAGLYQPQIGLALACGQHRVSEGGESILVHLH